MSWHGNVEDESGNVACLKCGLVQSSSFKACIKCCEHNNLEFGEDYDSGWHLVVSCHDCGKNFGFDNDDIIRNYRIIRKEA